MRTKLVSLTLLCWLGIAASAPAQMVEDYRFRGKTVDTKGAPLPEVAVVLREAKSGRRITFKTGKDGKFDRRMIVHGNYVATFDKEGFVTLEQNYDWSATAPDVIEVESEVRLQSIEDKQKGELDKASAELGKKSAKLYEEAYTAFTAGDCVKTEANTTELLGLGAGTYEYAVRYLRARCLQKSNASAAEAEAEYRKVMELKPDFFGAWFDLAGLLETKGNHAEALKLYTRAAELRPDDAEVHYNIGAIHLKAGHFEDARVQLARTVELNPSHAAAVKALALVYIAADKKDLPQALTLFKRYLELEPAAADAAQIQQYVQDLEKAR
jgi:Tfp pilus assembly protein PilF